MSVKLVNDDSLTDVADAIRIKGEISGTLEFPDGFISAIQAIPTGGITPSGTYSITSNGIYDIVSFASVDVNVSGGGGGITADDIAMRTISGVISGSATEIKSAAFSNCSRITEVNFPIATNIGNSAFISCTSLTIANFSSMITVGSSAFYRCQYLETISFPSLRIIYNNAFASCQSLSVASFPSVTSIAANAFNGCSKLEKLYLTGSSVAKATQNAFANTPMSNSTYTGSFGSIYVPASLVDSYKIASGFSYYADRITSYTE